MRLRAIAAISAFAICGIASAEPASDEAITASAGRNVVYPEKSKANEETGIVSVDAVLSSAGEVINARLSSRSGFVLLDRAAVDAVAKVRVDPSADGRPIRCTFNFQLYDNKRELEEHAKQQNVVCFTIKK